ncbi:MalY/PatB family protein [Ralstonia solanacearum]|uniref:cysteine-S-conjugate beta-lyase n=1 Tax=Ralstonia solanacearum TaxID=305 RepID=A0AAE3NGD8_RALSL|nr:aminotransferase class I/II-fold pyridoxal phosphate-dependent enzyme [Ralstonia solanacearum]MDB0521450.1 aminotransferase class I/II-fold pyridoxal phosphate-dependent enzyme [Ralstonia solanacearum]
MICAPDGGSSGPIEFLLNKQQLLARRSRKWGIYEPGVIAASIADMDFRVAPQVQASIVRNVEDNAYGYPLRDGDRADRTVAAAFATRMAARFNWQVDPDRVLVLADLAQAIYATLMAYSDPGDGVILQVPCYPPIREAIASTGRRLIPLEMERTPDGHIFDLDKLAEAVGDGRARILLLCNPQNPTGRVFTRSELERVAEFADRHDLVIISDEIHSDLVYAGSRHIPTAAASPQALARTVTLNSATKSFNIPGLRCAVAYFGTPALMHRFHARLPPRLTGAVNSLGIDATVAAWSEGQPWLDVVLDHLHAMRDYVADALRREFPDLRFHVPQASYLLWIDAGELALGEPAFDFFLREARVGFSAGRDFHPGASNFIRMNFATSRAMVDEILDRMARAVRARA